MLFVSAFFGMLYELVLSPLFVFFWALVFFVFSVCIVGEIIRRLVT